MAAYLLGLTAGGGLPVITRTKGQLKSLPFPVIGSLNGVHMFAASNQVDLVSATTEEAKVIWKDYYNSLVLIIVGRDDNTNDQFLQRVLDSVFHAMVLVYGLDDVVNIKNVERFKREIKVCYRMVDQLLEQEDSTSLSDLTVTADVIVGQETHILQTYLDAFAEAASSPYGCLFIKGSIAAATKKWWELSRLELMLLSLLVTSSPPCTARDVPVFLPISSPKVPHRLLTYQLLPGVEVCVICGPTPTLAQLEREVDRFWRSCLDCLRSTAKLYPRNFPYAVPLDSNIIGLLYINLESNKSLCSVKPHHEDGRRKVSTTLPDQRRRLRILRGFYKSVTGKLLDAPELPPLVDNPESAKPVPEENRLPHRVLDTYMCADTHKCYALQADVHQLFIVYSTAIPTYAMRSVTQKTLNTLLQEKCIQL